jgi:hypothetical protein
MVEQGPEFPCCSQNCLFASVCVGEALANIHLQQQRLSIVTPVLLSDVPAGKYA